MWDPAERQFANRPAGYSQKHSFSVERLHLWGGQTGNVHTALAIYIPTLQDGETMLNHHFGWLNHSTKEKSSSSSERLFLYSSLRQVPLANQRDVSPTRIPILTCKRLRLHQQNQDVTKILVSIDLIRTLFMFFGHFRWGSPCFWPSKHRGAPGHPRLEGPWSCS